MSEKTKYHDRSTWICSLLSVGKSDDAVVVYVVDVQQLKVSGEGKRLLVGFH